VERDEDEQHMEEVYLFLSLTYPACKAYPEHLLYPMDKKLQKGHLVLTKIRTDGSILNAHGDPLTALNMTSARTAKATQDKTSSGSASIL
jgi:hypothetical protein